MVLPAVMAGLGAVPAVAGFIGNLANGDRADAAAMARESAAGRGPQAQAMRASVDRATRQMIGASQANPSTNPNAAHRNALLAGAELQANIAPDLARAQAADARAGQQALMQYGTQQGAMLQQGLGAIGGALSSAGGFLAANPAAEEAPAGVGATPAALMGGNGAPNLGGAGGQLTAPMLQMGGGGSGLAQQVAAQPQAMQAPQLQVQTPQLMQPQAFGQQATQGMPTPQLQGIDPRLLMYGQGQGWGY